MKKFLCAILLVLCFAMPFAFASCNGGDSVAIYVPDGAPALAVANIIDSGKIADKQAVVSATTGENVKSNCVNGQADIAILPTNAAVKICHDNPDYLLFTVNVWGLLYVVGWQDIDSLSELCNHTVCSIGLGDTGEWLFKRILEYNNVPYEGNNAVNVSYVTDGTEAVGKLMSWQCEFALLGEPAVTNAVNKAQSQNRTLYRLFDLQALWQQVTDSDETGYPQASVIVRKSLVQEDSFANALYLMLVQNTQFLADNVQRLNDVLQSAGSLLAVNYTTDTLAACNLNAVKACTVKEVVQGYLSYFNGQFASMLRDDMYYDFGN